MPKVHDFVVTGKSADGKVHAEIRFGDYRVLLTGTLFSSLRLYSVVPHRPKLPCEPYSQPRFF